MDTAFWLDRWREGRTFFHQNKVMPLLQKYWPGLDLPPASRVLVPLCGKSLDMRWLAEQGYRVLGVELSPLAVTQFFEEQGLEARVHHTSAGAHHVSGNIEIICGDIFALGAEVLASCTGVYDRAALIALPHTMRDSYVRHVYGGLAPDCRGLMISLDYPQEQMAGPPFSVPDHEVQTLFAPVSKARLIDRRDVLAHEPKFAERGVERLDTLVYELHGHPRG